MRPVLRAACALAAATFAAVAAGAPPEATPATVAEKLSYAIALEVARRFADQGLAVDEAMALRGLRDAARGSAALPDDEVRRLLNSLQAQARQKSAQDRRIALLRNQRNGEATLQSLDARAGMHRLDDGIRYRIERAGDGEAPQLAPRERVRFVARTLEGREVARIGEREPQLVDTQSLIPGLRKALSRMPSGARWTLWIPPEQAYGLAGNGEVGPGELLVFEFERHAGPAL